MHAIEAHHNEVEARTVEAVLTQAADAISGGRPGARRESLESYVKRLERLEEIAAGARRRRQGVRDAGRPRDPGDGAARRRSTTSRAQVLARDIAKQVEEELTYPGQIRVTVVRETGPPRSPADRRPPAARAAGSAVQLSQGRRGAAQPPGRRRRAGRGHRTLGGRTTGVDGPSSHRLGAGSHVTRRTRGPTCLDLGDRGSCDQVLLQSQVRLGDA